MRFFLILLLTLSIYANDRLDNYRTNGIDAIQKEMDFQLTQKEYWNEYIQDIDTNFGYLESYPNILTCNKEASTLNLYIKDSNNTYAFQKEYSAYTGKVKGDKIKEGDLKTPIGIYQIVKKLSRENKLDSFYGPLAFVTSYPNTYDKYRGKNGHGIWIHGLPTKQSRDKFTKGCIAINNSNIECLGEKIDIEKTILIINSSEVSQTTSKETLALLLSELYSWRYSWIYNDIESYLDFYSDEFIRFDGMKIDKFKKYKTRIFKKMEKKTIIFNDINIIPYPNSTDVYQITFIEFYKSDTFTFNGEKTLIVKIVDNKMKIVTEK